MFSPVCVIPSVHWERGWLPSMHHRSHDQGGLHPEGRVCIHWVCIQEGLHPRGSASSGGYASWDTTGYGQRSSGIHPAGMHSCLIFFLLAIKCTKCRMIVAASKMPLSMTQETCLLLLALRATLLV